MHEVLLRYLGSEEQQSSELAEDNGALLRYLTRALRNQLVSLARKRDAARRPPPERRQPWPESDAFPATSASPEQLVEIDELLNDLAEVNPRFAQVIELMFFGGCSLREVAEALDVPERSVRSDWEFSRSWLGKKIR